MGAWGLGLFQSDHDLDCISYIEADLGLISSSDDGNDNDNDNDNDDNRNTLYFPSDPTHIRNLLNAGKLASTSSAYLGRVGRTPQDPDEEWFTVEYKLVLLAACAMQLGCVLPGELTAFASANYRSVGLQRDALTQMKAALEGYAGEPWDFESKGLVETVNSGGPEQEGDQVFPGGGLINVPSPGSSFVNPGFMRRMAEMVRRQQEAGERDFPEGTCGNCGSEKGVGGNGLRRCGRCKEKKYCGRECQKKHWRKHKIICKAPE